MVAGFLPPSAGEILVRGERVKGPGVDRAVVFQGDAALFNWLTTEENVEFGLRMRGVPAGDNAGVSWPRISGWSAWKASSTIIPISSPGACASACRSRGFLPMIPAILLMDEPFGALDAQTRGIMQQELSRIWSSRKKTVLFITHDIEESLLLGDRIAIMTAGPAATIKKVLTVPLTRPRELGEDFLRLRREIKAAIEEEVMKSMRQVQ